MWKLMSIGRLLVLVIMCAANNCLGQTKEEVYREFTLELEANERFFFKEGLYPGQKRNYLSLAVHPEYSLEWKDGKHSLNFTGFLRLDQYDKKRNHWDIRELYWQSVFKNTEFSIGAKKVFWGKTESAHLVDIINQTDVVESFDGEQKLGEVMVHLSQSVSIRASKEKVFDALTKEIDQWWGPVDRYAQKVGDVFKIDFGGGSHWRFKVVALSESEKVVWECVESNQDHNIEGMDEEWLGSKLHWDISGKQQEVEVKFLHQGLVPQGNCYGACSTAWDFYVTDSLKSFLETGEGKPEEM